MDPNSKLKLLRSVWLLDQIPDRQLATLEGFLSPTDYEDGAVIFEEGSQGDSLYFVTSGKVRISKHVSGDQMKDLAILGPGDCFGEMVLVEAVARSARATAVGGTALLRLHREDLDRWLKSHPELALDFFSELVQVLSKRLRRTSNELTMIFDLSRLLLERIRTGPELLAKVLDRVLPHLEGSWSAAAYLYNVFNDEMDLAAGQGGFDFEPLRANLPEAAAWLDPQNYYVALPGNGRAHAHGYLLLHADAALSEDMRAEAGRTLTTVAHLLASALENIDFRTEASLRERLKENRPHGPNI
ncbi:MAG: cyclic nucleotide-binding domain-containing protein [Elusimicrobiota bacterium]|jgi:CRP-like cAMP-binding protein